MGITKEDIVKDFDRVEGRTGLFKMDLPNGHQVIYSNGEFGLYFNNLKITDQHTELVGKEECIKKALDLLPVINRFTSRGIDFYGFEEY